MGKKIMLFFVAIFVFIFSAGCDEKCQNCDDYCNLVDNPSDTDPQYCYDVYVDYMYDRNEMMKHCEKVTPLENQIACYFYFGFEPCEEVCKTGCSDWIIENQDNFLDFLCPCEKF